MQVQRLKPRSLKEFFSFSLYSFLPPSLFQKIQMGFSGFLFKGGKIRGSKTHRSD